MNAGRSGSYIEVSIAAGGVFNLRILWICGEKSAVPERHVSVPTIFPPMCLNAVAKYRG